MTSVLDEIRRIQSAKTDIEKAIEYCGVNIPDTALIDTYASYIKSIPDILFTTLSYDLIGGDDLYIKTIKQSNGLINATTGGLVSSTSSGLAPKVINTNTATVGSAYYVLASSNGSNTPSWYKLPANAFANDDTKVTQTNTTDSANYRVLLSGNANDTTETTTVRKSANLLFNPSTGNLTTTSLNLNGDIIINDGTNHNRYIKWLYANTDDYGWRIGYLGSNSGDDNDLTFDSYRKTEGWASALYFKHTTLNAHFAGIVTAPTFQGNLDGSYINALTDYTKSKTASDIVSTDTLNAALGKLEYKADVAYTLVKGAYDGDGTIENLAEILKVLEGISDTDTINAIVGKYLPLTGGELTGQLKISQGNLLISSGHTVTGWLYPKDDGESSLGQGTRRWKDTYTVLINGGTPLQSNNYNSYAPKLDGTGATGTWDISISGTSANADKLDGLDSTSYLHSVGIIKDQDFNVVNGIDSNGNSYYNINYSLSADFLQINSPYSYGMLTSLNCHTAGMDFATNGPLGNTIGLKFRKRWLNNFSEWKTVAFTSDLASYVTLDTTLTITGLKTFESNSSTTGISLILKNKGWALDMSTAMDFYNGAAYKVPNARIETKMVGSGKAGGTLIFYTLQAHAETNPNPNGLTERFRIGDDGISKITGAFTVTGNVTATGFLKSDSSNNYVLLGGGGHKALSDFLLKTEFASKELSSNLTTITKTLVVSKDWVDTGIVFNAATFPNGTGSYIVQLSRDDAYYWTGCLSIVISNNVTATDSDEILLHGGGFDSGFLYYLRTVHDTTNKVVKLQIARNSTYSTSKTYTFKFKKLI